MWLRLQEEALHLSHWSVILESVLIVQTEMDLLNCKSCNLAQLALHCILRTILSHRLIPTLCIFVFDCSMSIQGHQCVV